MRSVDAWEGKDDDTPVPPRVRVRVFDRCEGRCHKCTRKILAGEKWTLEHRVALINGGKNAERNLTITCCNCLSEKNSDDMSEKSKTYETRAKHLGVELKRKKGWGWR